MNEDLRDLSNKELWDIIGDLSPYMSNGESVRRDAAKLEIKRRERQAHEQNS